MLRKEAALPEQVLCCRQRSLAAEHHRPNSQPSRDRESSRPDPSIAGWGCSVSLRRRLSYSLPLPPPLSFPQTPPGICR